MQIAENTIADGMSMEGNEFQEAICKLIKERKPRKIRDLLPTENHSGV